jgi:hypothetical protein
MSSNKDVLFCSNFCEHSKQILIDIQKRNARDMFVIVFVDNTRVKLPSQIDRVPAIITKAGNTYFEDDVGKYISTFCRPGSTGEGDQQPPPQEDVAPFSLLSDVKSFSDTFTFIDEGSHKDDQRVRRFDYLASDDASSMAPMQTAAIKDSGKKSKLDEAYEKYVMDRDSDIAKLKASNKRVV